MVTLESYTDGQLGSGLIRWLHSLKPFQTKWKFSFRNNRKQSSYKDNILLLERKFSDLLNAVTTEMFGRSRTEVSCVIAWYSNWSDEQVCS